MRQFVDESDVLLRSLVESKRVSSSEQNDIERIDKTCFKCDNSRRIRNTNIIFR